MKKLIPLNIAVKGIILIISFTIIFHLLVVLGLVPADIVWGGNFSSRSEIYLMEAISIVINVVMLTMILVYAGILRIKINKKVVLGFIWIMFVLFLLNTIGNFMAKSSLETLIFTPITFILSLFCFRIAAYDSQYKQQLL